MTNGEAARRTAAITGAGSGLGRSVALKLADKGYRVYGTGLAEYYGRDLTGKTTAHLRPEVRALVIAEYGEVCRSGKPLVVTHARRVREQRTPVEKLILPFGAADGDGVERLLAGVYPNGD